MGESATSADLAEFYSEQGRHGIYCSVGLVLGQLDAERAARLCAALADPLLQHAAISRTLRKWGVSVGRDSVQRHRNGICRCDRD